MQPALTRARVVPARALVLVGVLVAAAASIWPTWPPLFETWRVMPEYSYALLLVPFIACWIAARSAALPPPAARIPPLAVAALLGCIAAWMVAYKASSAIGQQLLIPLMLWSAVWMAFGLPIARRLAVPLACLYFAIPVWEFLVPFLQSASVWVAETVLGAIGIPVHIDGDLVSIPEGTFRIAEACAGRRYFIVCMTIAALLAGTTRMRPWRATGFLLLAAVLSLITNWIRVLIVIYAGHVTDMTSYLVAKEHLSLGWVLFALLMIIVCWIGMRVAKTGALPPFERGESPDDGARDLLRRSAVPATILALLIPVVAIAYARRESAVAIPPDGGAAALSLPAAGGDAWSSPQPADTEWRPRYSGAAALARASYDGPLGRVEVFAADYVRERRGAKLVSSANALFPGDWMVVRRARLGGIARARLPARPRLVRVETPAGEHWLISYLYGVDDLVTGNAIAEQLAYGVLSWGRPIHSRIAAVATRCRSSCEVARRRLVSFWSAEGAQLLDSGSGDRR